MFDVDAVARSRSGLALVIGAVIVATVGVAITAYALLSDRYHPPRRAPQVRALQPAELPPGIPGALTPDPSATDQIVALLDSLRSRSHKPPTVDWVHFRCVEATTLLTAEREGETPGDRRAHHARLIALFPDSWVRSVGKDALYVRSPDNAIEVAIPDPQNRDAVDELARALQPDRVIAFVYRLRPC